MKQKKLLEAVEESTAVAVEKGQAALTDAAARLAPYVEQAGDFVAPLADEARRMSAEAAADAYARIKPALHDARVQSARFAADTFDRVHPILDEALDKVTPAVERTVERVAPVVDDALSRITPTVDIARDAVQNDWLPKLAAALNEAAKQPLTAEVAARLAAATAALASTVESAVEETKATVKKKSFARTFGKILLAFSVLAGVAFAVKKLLASPSSGWEAHSPSDAYIANPVQDVVDKTAAAAAGAAAAATEVAEDVQEAVADVTEEVAEKAGDLVEGASDVVEDVQDSAQDVAEAVEEELEKLADEAEGGDASPLAGSPYGEGSYVGAEPPEGFVIKGNNRSMKFHVPGSAAYERTIPDVWFNNPDAAEAAGFVRAQR